MADSHTNSWASAFFHASIPTLAFGGVGDSGQGSYRGKDIARKNDDPLHDVASRVLASPRVFPQNGVFADAQKQSRCWDNYGAVLILVA